MGALADHDSRTRRRLRDRRRIGGRRPRAAVRSAMSFIVKNEITIVGMFFSQNGFQTIKPGTAADIVFDNAPGRIFHAKITVIPKGVGQGQIAVSGTLARTNAIGGTSVFPAVSSIPNEMSRDSLLLGMTGNVTAFSEKAGVIGLLASFLYGSAPTPPTFSRRGTEIVFCCGGAHPPR